MRRRVDLVFAVLLVLSGAPVGPAAALVLNLPEGAATVAEQAVSPGSYLLPTGPFRNGSVPGQSFEGAVQHTAWKIDTPGATTLALLAPLRDQLAAEGFRVVFECEAQGCGGFDFRFATPILPEPDMHVDLGDFRFLSARRDDEAVGLIVSRSTTAGFVQLTHVGPGSAEPPAFATTESPVVPARPAAQSLTPDASVSAPPVSLGDALARSGSSVLAGLSFASGSASLADGTYGSLDALADWLSRNPEMTVAIVGHTDASGSLGANIALSKRRAESVMQYLLKRHGVPARQVAAEGVGYLAPVASNLTPEGREKNRRVEVMVTSTQLKP